jgi:hypothetical protein
MAVTAETKLRELLQRYPYLREFLKAYNPAYEKLDSPVLFQTVGRFASLRTVAEMGGVPVERLLDDIAAEIARREIHAAETAGAGAGGGGAGAGGAGRERRQEALKGIIRDLHDGAPVEEVKARFDEITQEVDAAEIAAMEQALIAEGVPVEEVQRLCDVHVTVFKEALESTQEEQADALAVPPGHPVDSYRRENAVIGTITESMRCTLPDLSAEDPRRSSEAAAAIAADLERLGPLETHYTRKENQLFPLLERHGVEGPTKVMWALDDEIRARIAADLQAARSGDAAVLAERLPETLRMVEDMVYKEERILFPTAIEVLSEGEWEAMAAGEAEIGFAWIEPPASFPTAPTSAGAGVSGAEAAGATSAAGLPTQLPLTTGALTLAQVDLLFGHLPFDLTFVDAEDRVRFYSEGRRVFPRSPAVIGRGVRNCHPPKSVDRVEQIVAAFKAGEKNVAEFWIEHNGRFVHIRYFAVRDASGAYQGVLEVVQDATEVRALEGERRITDW